VRLASAFLSSSSSECGEGGEERSVVCRSPLRALLVPRELPEEARPNIGQLASPEPITSVPSGAIATAIAATAIAATATPAARRPAQSHAQDVRARLA